MDQTSLKYHVILDSCGNPDHGQDPSTAISAPALREVSSIEEASKVCQEYISTWNLGGGNWIGGDVLEGKQRVAHISYNGRIWPPRKEAELTMPDCRSKFLKGTYHADERANEDNALNGAKRSKSKPR